MKLLALSLFLFVTFFSACQTPTVGLTYYSDSVTSGYTLFAPDDNNSVYLINPCGELVNEWVFNELPGLTCYILNNGNLLYAGKDSLVIRDWNDNTLWKYATTANGIRQHHDIEPLPNGNILCVATDQISLALATSAGRDPSNVGTNFRMDKIIEIEPVGTNSANIVWEWRFFDHLIQDFDSTKSNYGVVENAPELIDINYNNGLDDWTHVNSVDYNVDLDQILISARSMSELYIIDHSTTTAEAAGHTGGDAGKGGDLLWRWGNPIVYRAGSLLDQQLIEQHDGKWVANGYPNAGKISVFNNGGDGSGSFSSIHLIAPSMTGLNYTLSGSAFDPGTFADTWNGNAVTPVVVSNKKCSVQSLNNGGYLICDSNQGMLLELNANKDVVWKYINPHGFGPINNQYDVLASGNAVFRAHKYAENHPGILANTLTTSGTIEDMNPVSDSCALTAGIETHLFDAMMVVNPIQNDRIELLHAPEIGEMKLIDLNGKLIQRWQLNGSNSYAIPGVHAGTYVLLVEGESSVAQRKIMVLD